MKVVREILHAQQQVGALQTRLAEAETQRYPLSVGDEPAPALAIWCSRRHRSYVLSILIQSDMRVGAA